MKQAWARGAREYTKTVRGDDGDGDDDKSQSEKCSEPSLSEWKLETFTLARRRRCFSRALSARAKFMRVVAHACVSARGPRVL